MDAASRAASDRLRRALAYDSPIPSDARTCPDSAARSEFLRRGRLAKRRPTIGLSRRRSACAPARVTTTSPTRISGASWTQPVNRATARRIASSSRANASSSGGSRMSRSGASIRYTQVLRSGRGCSARALGPANGTPGRGSGACPIWATSPPGDGPRSRSASLSHAPTGYAPTRRRAWNCPPHRANAEKTGLSKRPSSVASYRVRTGRRW